jgi:hypothetical protein
MPAALSCPPGVEAAIFSSSSVVGRDVGKSAALRWMKSGLHPCIGCGFHAE